MTRLSLLLSVSTLLLPPAGAWICAAVARACGGSLRLSTALLLLSAVTALAERPRALVPSAADTSRPRAVRLHGTWREPPAQQPHLLTAAGPVALRLPADVRAPPPGTPVCVEARYTPPRSPLVATLVVTGPARGAWSDRWAAAARARVRTLLSIDAGPVVEAIVLGRRDRLGWSVRRACLRAGAMHLLALSGLHVSLLSGVFAAALALLGARRALAHASLLLSFLALAGARPPLVRATLGALLLARSRTLGSHVPGPLRLAVVATVVFTLVPAWRSDLSARLSFTAVAGLGAATTLARGPLLGFLAPLGAFLATAPLCIETFGRVQPFGVLTTPLLVPFVVVMLAVSCVAILPVDTFDVLDVVTAPLLEVTTRAFLVTLEALAHVLPEPLEPRPLPVDGWAASIAVCVALLVLADAKRTSAGPHPRPSV